MTLQDWSNVASLAENAATVVAMLVGGWWTYRLFIKNRTAFPRASITISSAVLTELMQGKVLRAELVVKNEGDVLLPLRSLECRLLQIEPLAGSVSKRLDEGGPLVLDTDHTVHWPMIEKREWSYPDKRAEIEPGESQTFCVDFLICPEVRRVEVFCYLPNLSKKSKIGWTTTIFVDLTVTGGQMIATSQREERQLPRAPISESVPNRRPQLPPQPEPERVPPPPPPSAPKK